MAEHDVQYRHTALTDAQRQIRLLRILPEPALEGDDGNIACEMTVHDRDKAGLEYVAISYVWGSQGRTKTIYIDGFPFCVGYNCWYALLQVKNATPQPDTVGTDDDLEFSFRDSRLIWIDAICIDQNSVREKNHQVQKMGMIYASATFVAACIGDEADLLVSMTRPPDFGHTADELSIWGRPYFNRLWTAQECLNAGELVIFAGLKFVSRSRLWHMDLPDVAKLNLGLFGHPASKSSLSFLVTFYSLRKCADLRDTIYALLSATDHVTRSMWTIDYNISLGTLLFDFITYEIRRVEQKDGNYHFSSLKMARTAVLFLFMRFAADASFCEDLVALYLRDHRRTTPGDGSAAQKKASLDSSQKLIRLCAQSYRVEILRNEPHMLVPGHAFDAGPSGDLDVHPQDTFCTRLSNAVCFDPAWSEDGFARRDEYDNMVSTTLPAWSDRGDVLLVPQLGKNNQGLFNSEPPISFVCWQELDGRLELKGLSRRLGRSSPLEFAEETWMCNVHIHPQDFLSFILLSLQNRKHWKKPFASIRCHPRSYVERIRHDLSA